MPPVQIYYVLFLSKAIPDIETRFTHACNGSIDILTTAKEGDSKAGVVLTCESIEERPLPNPQALAYFGRGFDAESAAELARSNAAIALTGVGPFDPEHKLLRQLTACVNRLARELNAFVFDAADWLTFTPKAFHALRGAEVADGQLSSAQFGVRAYRVEGGLRSLSMGLEKFGQPNFALPLFSEHQLGMMDRLMTLVLQHFIESDRPLAPGPLALSITDLQNQRVKQKLTSIGQPTASGKATVQLDLVPRLPGDPEVLLAPVFNAPPGPPLWEEQGELLKRLFEISMWTPRTAELPNAAGIRLAFALNGRTATFAEVLGAWQADPSFRAQFNAALADAPFAAFRWETPAVTAATLGQPFECVLLDSPRLATRPDQQSFAKHFRRAPGQVVSFTNLGGDALLVVPCPVAEPSAYAHLAAFVRLAPGAQQQVLWQTVGEVMARRVGSKPVWLSTAGAGVSWLHVRLDDRPKYYGYEPYRIYRELSAPAQAAESGD